MKNDLEMIGLGNNKEVVALLRDAAKDFQVVKTSFERVLEEEREKYDALPYDQKYEDPGLELGDYVDALEDAIEELDQTDSNMEDTISSMEDALWEKSLLDL